MSSATSTMNAEEVIRADQGEPIPQKGKKSLSFWLCMLALNISLFLSALDLTSVSTALPTIIDDLGGSQFVWIGSAYTLASIAFLPLAGQFARIFGRRPTMIISLVLFAFGSALCGGAQNMNMLIGGRTVQGIGTGGILALSEIVLSDLVPLSERGAYQGAIGMTWAIASVLGPIIGGAFAQNKSYTWRGLFYLNLPLTGIAMVLVLFFMNLRIPHDSLLAKIRRIDWIGNFLIMGASTSALLGLTWGGVQFPWTSAQVLVPLILGFVGLFAFMLYEAYVPADPTIPFTILKNRTSLTSFVGVGMHGIEVAAAFYYLPVYFQACKDATPLHSGTDLIPYTITIAPIAVVSGILITLFGRYTWQNYFAWVTIIIGMGLQSTLGADSAARNWIGFQILTGVGFGIMFTAVTFGILAPLKPEDNASALTFLVFIRSFFQAFGITIGSTVLQNELSKKLPASYIASIPGGVANLYGIIPTIPSLSEPLKSQVQQGFAESIAVIWQVLIGIGGIGLISVFFMKELPLQDVKDENWGLKEKKKVGDVEEGSGAGAGAEKNGRQSRSGDVTPIATEVNAEKDVDEEIERVPAESTA